MTDYAFVLSRRYRDCEWSLHGDDYDGLEWKSDSPKPTRKQLDAAYPQVVAEVEAEKQAAVAARESALAKLSALGLTDAEIAALVGG